jgi:hypothetical protein
MRLNRAAAAAIAAIAIVSGCGVTHHGAIAVGHSTKTITTTVTRPVHPHSPVKHTAPPVKHTAAPADPSLAWLESAGGQAQLTFNDDVDTLAADLQTEDHAPTVANHLVFEADARAVQAEARQILRTPALLPTHNRAAYEQMLNDFITVANLLQPGPGYGTTAQDETAWYTALNASNITVY